MKAHVFMIFINNNKKKINCEGLYSNGILYVYDSLSTITETPRSSLI